MRFRHLAAAALGALLLIPTFASAQSARAQQTALDYLVRNADRHGVTPADVSDMLVYDQRTSSRSGVTSVYVHQKVGTTPVVAGQMTINVLPDGRVLYAAGELVRDLASKASTGGASVTASAAASALASDRNLAQTQPFTAIDQLDGKIILSGGGVSAYGVPARLVYQTDEATGVLHLAWEIGIYTLDANHYWEGFVDAQTGRVIRVTDQVVHDNFGGPEAAEVATEAPASAAPVADAPYFLAAVPQAQVPGYRVYAMPIESPTWATPAPPADARTLVADPSDALASPYGWHDTDGVAGPEHTITRGNNVFAYPDVDNNNGPDAVGVPDGGASLTFDFPLDLTQDPATYKEAATTNLFYWNNIIHDLMYQYGFDEAGGNFQTNNYGRGGVDFDDAVHAEAQDASNGSGNCNANFWTPTDSGGGSLGPRPRMQMYTCDLAAVDTDGDLDAGVIIHEYGHGISKRLTGGPANTSCLGNAEQGGEGWSDWFGILMTMDAGDAGTDRRPIGNFLLGQPQSGNGIRGTGYQPAPGAPYSTDFAINSATYGNTNSGLSAPHGVGFVWSTILWEMTWELIGANGWSPDLYNAAGTAGNQIALNLVIEGLKMQPCSPGFVDARNAILAADVALYGGAYTDLLWAAFARRGLGIGADQGSPTSRSDQTEDFAEPESIAPDPITDLAATPDGDAVTLTFTATGDDGAVGTATSYDVRYSTTPIVTDADFDAATPATGEPAPQVAGTTETFRIEGLAFSTTYYIAMKVEDNSFNISDLSNVVQVTTLAAPVAVVPTDPIVAAVASPGDVTTGTVTMSNTGPSTLSYSVNLNETTTARPVAPASTGGALVDRNADKSQESAPGTAQRFGEGGPDAFGYRWIDSDEAGGPVFDWVDISATGTMVTLTDDSSSPPLTLPWNFPFYGVDYPDLNIGSNGILTFGAGSSSLSNQNLPNPAAPNNLIAMYWDDLNPALGGTVHYQDMGDGRYIVQFTDVPHYNSASETTTFQAILFQGGQIVLQYATMNDDVSDPNGHTIGIENADGTDGLTVVYNAAYMHDNLAIKISALWVEADLTSGMIPAGGSETITLTFDSAGLAVGTYTANMVVTTNDPSNTSVVIPVTFQVGTVSETPGVTDFEGTHLLGEVYPNPSAGSSRVALAVAEAQAVRAELYDALGRRVAVVYDATMPARVSTPIEVTSSALATGTYVLRVTGERFTDSRRVTVTR